MRIRTQAGLSRRRHGGGVCARWQLVAQGQVSAGGIETVSVRPNFFMIVGAGGNIGVQVGDDGPVIVDSGTERAAEAALAAAVKRLTPAHSLHHQHQRRRRSRRRQRAARAGRSNARRRLEGWGRAMATTVAAADRRHRERSCCE